MTVQQCFSLIHMFQCHRKIPLFHKKEHIFKLAVDFKVCPILTGFGFTGNDFLQSLIHLFEIKMFQTILPGIAIHSDNA